VLWFLTREPWTAFKQKALKLHKGIKTIASLNEEQQRLEGDPIWLFPCLATCATSRKMAGKEAITDEAVRSLFDSLSQHMKRKEEEKNIAHACDVSIYLLLLDVCPSFRSIWQGQRLNGVARRPPLQYDPPTRMSRTEKR